MSVCVCVGKEKILFFLFLLVSSGRFLISNATSTSIKNCLWEKSKRGKNIKTFRRRKRKKKKMRGEKGVRAALSIKRHFQREVRRLQTRRWKPWRSWLPYVVCCRCRWGHGRKPRMEGIKSLRWSNAPASLSYFPFFFLLCPAFGLSEPMRFHFLLGFPLAPGITTMQHQKQKKKNKKKQERNFGFFHLCCCCWISFSDS